MPNPKITNPRTPDLALLHTLHHGPPTLTPLLPPPVRAMQQIQVDPAQPTLPQRLIHRPFRGGKRLVVLQFCCEQDVFAGDVRVGSDGRADLAFVVVPGGRVDGAVAGGEGVRDGGGAGGAGGLVDTEVEARDGVVVGELGGGGG